MIFFALVACRSPEPPAHSTVPPDATADTAASGSTDSTDTAPTIPDGPWLTDDRYVLMQHATVVLPEAYEWGFGASLATGMDLDHDGRAEWAVSAPQESEYNNRFVVVRVFEGTSAVTQRRPYDHDFEDDYGRILASGDVDGDGFRDLLLSARRLGYGQIQVLQSALPEEDAFVSLGYAQGEYQLNPWSIKVHDVPEAPALALILWDFGRSVITYGPVPIGASSSALVPLVLEPSDITIATVQNNGGEFVGYFASYHEVDLVLDSGSPTAVWTGLLTSSIEKFTGTWGQGELCALDVPISRSMTCEYVGPSSLTAGLKQVAGDLDGDAISELVTGFPTTRTTDGEVTVYNRDGSWRATIRGTQQAQLGYDQHITVDDHGDAWLLLSQTNINGDVLSTVYAFRGSNVVGELTDMDADRFYVDGTTGRRLGHAIESYRETPDSELMLLLSNPSQDDGLVYLLPFDPP